MKTCTKCNLPKDKFLNNKSTEDKLDHWCSDCRVEYNRQWKKTAKGKLSRTLASKRQYVAKMKRKEEGFCPSHTRTPVKLGNRCCQQCIWTKQEANLKHFYGIRTEDY